MSAPTDPVLLRIVENMQTALQRITRANGFFYDVDPKAVKVDPEPLATAKVVPMIVLGHRLEAKGRDLGTTQPVAVKETWGIWLECRVDFPGKDLRGRLRAFTQFAADLEVALRADVTRGGIAMYTTVGQPIPYFTFGEAETQIYIEQPVDVLLRRDYGVP